MRRCTPGGGSVSSPGGGLVSSRLDRWYVSAHRVGWIRDIDLSVPEPAADHDGIITRIGVPHHIVHMRKSRQVYPEPGCAKAAAKCAMLAALDTVWSVVEEVNFLLVVAVATARRLAD